MMIDGGEEPNESAEAVANTAVAAAEATENDRPVLDAADAIVRAGPAGPSPYSGKFERFLYCRLFPDFVHLV
jgi:hypothetical protein